MNNFLACFICQAPWSWGAYVHNVPQLLPERRLDQGWCRKLWAMQVPKRVHIAFWWMWYWLKFWCKNSPDSKPPKHLNQFQDTPVKHCWCYQLCRWCAQGGHLVLCDSCPQVLWIHIKDAQCSVNHYNALSLTKIWKLYFFNFGPTTCGTRYSKFIICKICRIAVIS